MKDYCTNEDKCRKDLLFSDMDVYFHMDMSTKCSCCDVCSSSCSCGSCYETHKDFIFMYMHKTKFTKFYFQSILSVLHYSGDVKCFEDEEMSDVYVHRHLV